MVLPFFTLADFGSGGLKAHVCRHGERRLDKAAILALLPASGLIAGPGCRLLLSRRRLGDLDKFW